MTEGRSAGGVAGGGAGGRGLIALGDSITRGRGGSPLLGVHPQSWALWLAEALELPVRILAVDGARSGDLVREQLPRVEDGYDLACLYIGANDARSMDFDAAGYERDVRTALERLDRAAGRAALLTIPEDLGRPRAGQDVLTANAILHAAAADAGAVLVELRDLRGWRDLLPDAVHPTAPGMLTIADRVAAALGADRLPSSLATPMTGRRETARYAAWWGRQWIRDRIRQTRERRAADLG